jgi:hypothetical protein
LLDLREDIFTAEAEEQRARVANYLFRCLFPLIEQLPVVLQLSKVPIVLSPVSPYLSPLLSVTWK